MKKIITWVLLLAMIVGLFAGCKKQDPTPVGDTPTVAQAMDYVKALYPNDPEVKKTPVDYERMGVVRINNVPFTVVWTTDVSEDLIKIVDNNDGTVTVDINEQCEADTPYTLTATITDGKGEKATHSWNYILPEAADMGEILKAAYALKPGESLPYESTLTGVVTVVKTPYDPSYKNITVIIEVAGYEDMPIECYRMKGEGVEEIAIGDTITVTGTLKNYNGTIEFDAGCICERIVPGERVQAPDDMKKIVDEAYALGANKSLPYEATLTGEIIEIGQAYDPSYKNITVTIVVEGREDKPIVCYRMKGEGCDKLKVTDVITVKGYITNYVGSKGQSTIEFTAGCQLVSYTPGVGVYAPTDPVEIMRIVKALGANQKTKFEAVLTGVITEVNSPYSSQYGNISVTMDVNGTNDEMYCYRIKGDGVDKIDVGDTITVKGYITNYVGDNGKSKIEYVAGSKLIKYVKGVKTELPSYNNIIAETLVPGQAYKLGQEQTAVAGSPWYYFNGKLANDFYLGTSEDGRKAVDVFVAEVSGGYNLYYKDATGATQYINIVEVMGNDGKLHINMDISGTAKTVYTFDSEKKVLTTMMGDTAYCIGTYNNYTTMAARKLSGCDMPAYLLTLEELTGSASMEEAAKKLEKDYPNGYDADMKLPTSFQIRGETFTVSWELKTTNEAAVKIVDGVVVVTQQDQAVNYQLIATITKSTTGETKTTTFSHIIASLPKPFVENPVAGTAYKMGMYTPKGILLFTGKTESKNVTYRLASIDDSEQAVNVYLEAVSGGYQLYFMDGETKTYIRIYENDPDNKKGSLELVTEQPAEVLVYDETVDTLVYTAPTGQKYFMGTYSSYTTFSVSNYSYIEGDKASTIDVSQYPARFYPENIVVEPAPIIEPEKDTLTIAEALEFGATLAHNSYSSKKYYVTGVITEVYNTSYGNMYIQDEAGNKLTVYGTYSADGETGYGKMDVKPVAGDTITVYGIIGQYSGAAQMKNGWIVAHVPGEGGPVEPEATEPTEPVAENELKLTVNSLGIADQSYTSSSKTVQGVGFEWIQLGNYGYGIQVRDKEGKTSYLWNTTAFPGAIKEIRLVANGGKSVYNNADCAIYSFGNAVDNYTYTTKLSTTSGVMEYVITPDGDYTFFKFEHDLGYTQYWDSITIVLADGTVLEPAEPEATEPEATEPEATEPEATEPTVPAESEVVSSITAGTAYKFAMNQVNKGAVYYFTGAMDGKYMATTTNAAEAADVFVEAVEGVDGGFYLYVMNGDVKTYITMEEYVSGSYYKANIVLTESVPSVYYTWSTDLNTIVCNTGNDTFCFGTFGTYTTLNTTSSYYVTGDNAAKVDVEQFIGRFYTVTSAPVVPDPTVPTEPEATEPETTEPETTEPTGPAYPENMEIVTAPAADTAYKLGLLQNNVGKTLYFAGTTANQPRFFTTTEDVEAATDVFVEEVTGGFRMYFMDGETKTYIDIAPVGNYINAGLTTEPSAVYTMNADYNTLVANVNGTDYYLGAYNTYETIGASTLSYAATSFPVNLLQIIEDPYAAQAAIMEQIKALEVGESISNVTLTGEITKINTPYDSGYKNVTVTIQVFGTEDTLKCFRIKGDAASILAVGDIITVNGVVKNYQHSSGDTELEFDAGSMITEHIPAEGGTTPDPEPPVTDDPAADSVLTVEQVIALGASKEHNTYTTGKYYVTGEITEVSNTTYGNMKIKDEAGNVLTIYGTYSADGSARYDAMDVKPVAGDTVTVYGVIGQYNGASQVKNGWITEHIPAEGGAETPEETEPETTVPEETVANEIKLTVDSLGIPSQSYTSSDAVINDVDFEWVQIGNYGNGIQVRDKDGKTSYLWNTSAFGKAIKEIRLVANGGKTTYNNPDCAIYSFGTEVGNYTYETKLSTVAGTYEYVITPDAETYTYFRFEHDLGYTQYWDSITIVLAD